MSDQIIQSHKLCVVRIHVYLFIYVANNTSLFCLKTFSNLSLSLYLIVLRRSYGTTRKSKLYCVRACVCLCMHACCNSKNMENIKNEWDIYRLNKSVAAVDFIPLELHKYTLYFFLIRTDE